MNGCRVRSSPGGVIALSEAEMQAQGYPRAYLTRQRIMHVLNASVSYAPCRQSMEGGLGTAGLHRAINRFLITLFKVSVTPVLEMAS